MVRFKVLTVVCLTAVALLVAANVWYLYGLYSSIKAQTFLTVGECVRRADICEIISRLGCTGSHGTDDSSIHMSLVVEGERAGHGSYDYHGFLDNIGPTMSGYFHLIEEADTLMPDRDYAAFDSLFITELHHAGLYPAKAFVGPVSQHADGTESLWSVDFAVAPGSPAVYRAYFSPLHRHILGRMAGIIVTSATILLIMAFLVGYLIHRVGRLRTIEQMKDDFTRNMTHELKTPVAVAYSAADSMLRYYDSTDETRNRRMLAIIMQRLDFLSGMIEKILSASMERFKSLKLNKESVELRPLVDDVAAMLRLKAPKSVAIETDIPEGLTVHADPLHLGNMLTNLIDNAIKYSRYSVQITVRADARCITVADNGIGISKSDRTRIFDRFYRVSMPGRNDVAGYGLGLYYVRRIAELHGWTIGVTANKPEGSVFTIIIDKR